MRREPNWAALDRDYERKCRKRWEEQNEAGLCECEECGAMNHSEEDHCLECGQPLKER